MAEGGSSAFGEASQKMLTKAAKPHRTHAVPRVDSPNPKVRKLSDTPSAEVSPSSIEVVRATTKYRVEPWRIAQDPKAHAKGLCKKNCEACLLLESLYEIKTDCTAAINMAMRMYRRVDEDALDQFIIKRGRRPNKGKEWPMPQAKAGTSFDVYRTIADAFPNVATSIMSLIARKAHQKWSQDRWDSLIFNKKMPPHFKETMPLPIRAQEVRLSAINEDVFRFGFSLHAAKSVNRVGGGRGPEFELPIHARDDRQVRELKALSLNEWRIGDAWIKQDKRRRGRWYLFVSYTRVINRKSSDVRRYAAINRGLFSFLVSVNDHAKEWLYEAQDIVAYLKQVQARRREYQYASKASGRDGHGKNHYLAPLRKLEGAGMRWRETKIKQLVRRYVNEFLIDEGITDLVLSNFSADGNERGIRDGLPEKLEGGKYIWDLIQEWPYLQLENRLISVCEELGIEVHKVNPAFVSQTCPRCSHVDEKSIILRWRQFTCTNCSYTRHLDVVAAMNLLEKHAGSDACSWVSERTSNVRYSAMM